MKGGIDSKYHTFIARFGFLVFRAYYRKFPLIRGKYFIRMRVHPHLRNKILICRYRGLSLHPMDFSLPRYNNMFYKDICEPEEEFLGRVLRHGMTFVDIGANIGSYSMPAAALVGTEGRVIAFEPASDNLAIFKETIALNNASNIILEQLALSDKSGEGKLRLHDGANTGQHALAVEGQAGVVESVTLTTLDDYLEQTGIRKVDVVKLDVEGVELKVLKGAAKTLSADAPPVLIVEVSDVNASRYGSTSGELFAFLEHTGYLRYKYSGGRLVKADTVEHRIVCENYIFIPAKMADNSQLFERIQSMIR